jgi:hypothetical protein
VTKSVAFDAGGKQHRDACAIVAILRAVVLHKISFLEEDSDKDVPSDDGRVSNTPHSQIRLIKQMSVSSKLEIST